MRLRALLRQLGPMMRWERRREGAVEEAVKGARERLAGPDPGPGHASLVDPDLDERQLWALVIVVGEARRHRDVEHEISRKEVLDRVEEITGKKLRLDGHCSVVVDNFIHVEGSGASARVKVGAHFTMVEHGELRMDLYGRYGLLRGAFPAGREDEDDDRPIEDPADYLVASIQAAECLRHGDREQHAGHRFSRTCTPVEDLLDERSGLADALEDYEKRFPDHPWAELIERLGLSRAEAMMLRLLLLDRVSGDSRRPGWEPRELARRVGMGTPAAQARALDLLRRDGPLMKESIVGTVPGVIRPGAFVMLTDEGLKRLCGEHLDARLYAPETEHARKGRRSRRRRGPYTYQDPDEPCSEGSWHVVHDLEDRPLVLPPELEHRLDRAIAAVPLRARVASELGYGKLLGYGLGSVFLFEGEPGTGKTLAAHVSARRIGKPLMTVAGARLLEKYVGETEKLIEQIFEVAEDEDAVLLIDEADSILRARHHADRNWEVTQVNVLLRCLEQLEGVAILTTNFVESLDPALERRITLHLRFPRPGPLERAAIWRALTQGRIRFPPTLDLDRLAVRHDLTGAQIKNAVLDLAVIAVQRRGRTVTEAEVHAAIADVSPGFEREQALVGFR